MARMHNLSAPDGLELLCLFSHCVWSRTFPAVISMAPVIRIAASRCPLVMHISSPIEPPIFPFGLHEIDWNDILTTCDICIMTTTAYFRLMSLPLMFFVMRGTRFSCATYRALFSTAAFCELSNQRLLSNHPSRNLKVSKSSARLPYMLIPWTWCRLLAEFAKSSRFVLSNF